MVVVADLAAPWPFWGTDEVNNRNKGQNPSILFWCWPSTVPQHCQTTHYPCQEDVDRYGVKSNALAFFHGSEYTFFYECGQINANTMKGINYDITPATQSNVSHHFGYFLVTLPLRILW
jgi:hypothetical protein